MAWQLQPLSPQAAATEARTPPPSPCSATREAPAARRLHTAAGEEPLLTATRGKPGQQQRSRTVQINLKRVLVKNCPNTLTETNSQQLGFYVLLAAKSSLWIKSAWPDNNITWTFKTNYSAANIRQEAKSIWNSKVHSKLICLIIYLCTFF